MSGKIRTNLLECRLGKDGQQQVAWMCRGIKGLLGTLQANNKGSSPWIGATTGNRLLVSTTEQDHWKTRPRLQCLQETACSGYLAVAELYWMSSLLHCWPTMQEPETSGESLSPTVFFQSPPVRNLNVIFTAKEMLEEILSIWHSINWRVNLELKGKNWHCLSHKRSTLACCHVPLAFSYPGSCCLY